MSSLSLTSDTPSIPFDKSYFDGEKSLVIKDIDKTDPLKRLKIAKPENFSREQGFSCSGQPTPNLFVDLCRYGIQSRKDTSKTPMQLSSFKWLVIDLREEDHFYVNDHAVSIRKGPDNDGNKELSQPQILEREEELIEKYRNNRITLNQIEKQKESSNDNKESKNEKISKKFLRQEEVYCHEVYSEETMLKNKMGTEECTYIRFPLTDHIIPTFERLQTLMTIVDTFKNTHWIHFHCAAGRGRAPMAFAAMYITKYAKSAQFEALVSSLLKMDVKLVCLDEKAKASKKEKYKVKFDIMKKIYEEARKS